ncbi:hypothetical protein OAF63_02425 [Saprospiraceae bacterium]|nr:hypothetical protein [Bacteroidota bacterium]MDB4727621.1 hypothetical protein [Saprospiraceae bacterium]
MFKSNLIESKSYYKLRSKKLLLMLLPSVPIGLLVNFYTIPIWLTTVMIGVYIVLIYLMNVNQKLIGQIIGNKRIEMDAEKIRIISGKGNTQEIIKLADIDKLLIKDNYSMPQETIKDVGMELTGKTIKNYLTLQLINGETRRFDFEFDSYYMIAQLNKTINSWEVKGCKIERTG